tara:strand:- start:1700 stop:3094 length:1395 start_codon:yes stop_codon:yes gene_type:complete
MAEIKSHQFYEQSPLLGARSGQDAIDRANETSSRRRMAEKLLESSSGFRRIDHPLQGVAQMAQAGVGAYMQNQADKEHDARQAKYDKDYSSIVGGLRETRGEDSIRTPGVGNVSFPGSVQQKTEPIPGSMQRALEIAQGIDNPDIKLLRNDLTIAQYQNEQASLAAAAQRKQEEADYRRKKAIDAEYKEPPVDKFGGSHIVVDPNSSTGYSRVRINQAGEKQILGEAPAPRELFNPNAGQNEARYKATTERYNQATNNLTEADTVLADVQSMLDLVEKVDSGSFAETKLAMRKVSLALGLDVDVDSIADAEAMRSKGMDFVLQRIAKTKGAISEKEMKAFKEASAGIENTQAGNRMILELARKVAERLKFESNAVRDAWGQNQSITVYDLDNVRINARKEFNEQGGLSVEPATGEPATTSVVDPPPGSTVPIEQMDAVQLNKARRGATPEQRVRIGNRLTELGY